MSNRITERQLQAVVDRINRETKKPNEPYTLVGGEYKANPGNYHLSQQYGGNSLHQMLAGDGGVRDVFGCGHMPKRELFDLMHAFLAGLSASEANTK